MTVPPHSQNKPPIPLGKNKVTQPKDYAAAATSHQSGPQVVIKKPEGRMAGAPPPVEPTGQQKTPNARPRSPPQQPPAPANGDPDGQIGSTAIGAILRVDDARLRNK